jgi:hypothetical protein
VMKVGGTHRRLDGALTFFGFAAWRDLSRCFSSAVFRVLDSGTISPCWLSR